jgi:hypothetical protein
MADAGTLYERQPAVIDIWQQCKERKWHHALTLIWCLHMWDKTEQTVYVDLLLLYCDDYGIDPTPALWEQAKIAAMFRTSKQPAGTIKKATRELLLWSAMVGISALKYHNPKKSIFDIVEMLQDKKTGRFGNVSLETLEEYWDKRLTKSQKESLREFWDIQTRAPALWGEDILRLLEGILNPR